MSELWSVVFLWSWPDRVARQRILPGCDELPTGLPAGLHSPILTIDRKLEEKRLKMWIRSGAGRISRLKCIRPFPD